MQEMEKGELIRLILYDTIKPEFYVIQIYALNKLNNGHD